MLTELTIRDLGVIPESTVEFSPGLTVLTGETGAGKTMVVTGLRLLSGGRADAGRVRTGAEKALVEGRIATTDLAESLADDVESVLSECGGERDENDEIILARQVSAKGRSRAWVGGRGTPASALAEISGAVLAIHGQNDQLRLLGSDEQRAALDRLGGESVRPLLEAYREVRGRWRAAAKDLEERTSKRREMAMRADQLEFALEEIDAVDPEPGEDERLTETIRRMQDLDGLREAAVVSWAAIDGPAAVGDSGAGAEDEEGAADKLGRAHQLLAASGDSELTELAERLAEITSGLTDVSAGLGAFLSGLPEETESLDGLLARQAEIRNLTRKYAPDIAGVLAWRDKARRKLGSLDVSGEALEKLAAEVADLEKKVKAAARKLTSVRKKLAVDLAKRVTVELHGLAMPHTSLVVDVTDSGSFGPAGADDVNFQLSAHKGAEPRPLASSASGGELSRVMLALEVVLAEGDGGRTLVFDEVDAGVGGRAAVEIGRRLGRLAARNQVIVVTHLPQVAAYADTHLHVAKDVGADSVVSGVTSLDRDRRIEELARMMAGLDGTESGRAHATDLLDRAEADREAHVEGK
ncbi:DNA repair protein RecN [uncultured Corynebacterium sp.]|uniref:DNA repair protein RecN n=1 Tax=uncultured Corynebacterium sp. TaxID=159447 RepID=UPI002609DEDC|nr:DNA repair protein RecN [uncultured Corynebacterium sp.]